MYRTDTLYTVSTGTKINPLQPETAVYYDEGQIAYIIADAFSPRTKVNAVTSFGRLGGLKVGSRVDVIAQGNRADRSLGRRVIIGIVDFATGAVEGDVPDCKLPHRVCK